MEEKQKMAEMLSANIENGVLIKKYQNEKHFITFKVIKDDFRKDRMKIYVNQFDLNIPNLIYHTKHRSYSGVKNVIENLFLSRTYTHTSEILTAMNNAANGYFLECEKYEKENKEDKKILNDLKNELEKIKLNTEISNVDGSFKVYKNQSNINAYIKGNVNNGNINAYINITGTLDKIIRIIEKIEDIQ